MENVGMFYGNLEYLQPFRKSHGHLVNSVIFGIFPPFVVCFTMQNLATLLQGGYFYLALVAPLDFLLPESFEPALSKNRRHVSMSNSALPTAKMSTKAIFHTFILLTNVFMYVHFLLKKVK
jgi:hypothetical protein